MSTASKHSLQPTQAWLEHHKFCFKGALTRQKHELARSLITWTCIAISLVLPTVLYIVMIQLEPLLESKPNPELNIYINNNQSNQVDTLTSIIETDYPNITIKRIDPDQALNQLSEAHNLETKLSFNPLPYTLIIQGNANTLKSIENELRLNDSVSATQLDREWIERWLWIVSIGERGLLTISLLLLLGSIATIGNTVAINIISRRHEIAVMTLVGATETFIRRPFVYFGVINGVMGGLLSCIILLGLTIALYSPWQQLIHSYNIPATSIPFGIWLFPIIIGSLIGSIGAAIACRRFIKQHI